MPRGPLGGPRPYTEFESFIVDLKFGVGNKFEHRESEIEAEIRNNTDADFTIQDNRNATLIIRQDPIMDDLSLAEFRYAIGVVEDNSTKGVGGRSSMRCE